MSISDSTSTGTFPVDGDVTPVSHETIDFVDAMDWNNMSISDLVDQRIVLTNRMCAAAACGSESTIIRSIQTGISQIDGIIKQKTNHES